MKIILISVFLIIINTLGQISLKKATLVENKLFYLAFGYFLFILAIVISFFLMKILELKYFTVIMSAIYISVLISSSIIFKEALDKNKIIGTILVISGIIIFIGV